MMSVHPTLGVLGMKGREIEKKKKKTKKICDVIEIEEKTKECIEIEIILGCMIIKI